MALRHSSRAAGAGALVVLITTIAPAGCGGGADRTSTTAGPPALSGGRLEACGNLPKPAGFRCGRIEVPLERSDPSLGTVGIGFAVRRPNDAKRRPLGAIFAVEGGPGYASGGTAGSYVSLFGHLLDRRELVLVDMRGTGHSDPIRCPDVQGITAPTWISVAQCARRLGPRFDSYRTSAAADDIDDVRRALGLDSITLYGDSYGTFLAQSYAFRHGGNLNALVLDSAYPAFGEDPWYPSLIRSGNRDLAIACRRSPRCRGNPRKRLRRTVDYLRAHEMNVGPLIDTIQAAAYSPPSSYVQVNRLERQLLGGETAAWRRLTAGRLHGYRHIRQFNLSDEYVVSCNDYPMIWDPGSSEAERRAQLQHAIRAYDQRAFLPFSPREVALSSQVGYLYCLTWPPPSSYYEPAVEPGARAPNVPVLVVSGELDDLTTPHEGSTVAGFFPNGRQFIAPNAGHVNALYYPHRPAARRIRAFLTRQLAG